MRQIEEENNRLKKIVADLTLDKAMLQDVYQAKALRPVGRRRLIDEVRKDWKMSIQSALWSQAELKTRLKEIAQTRVRYGYRRVHMLLRCDGWAVTIPTESAPLQGDGLPAQERVGKTAEGSLRGHPLQPGLAMDFLHDQCRNRVLAVVDTFSPVVDPRSEDGVATMVRACRSIGYPTTIRAIRAANCLPRPLPISVASNWPSHGRQGCPGKVQA
ncbi:hypothetical protein [Sinorhizobium terangae]|uniref:hypothetical protein n=1 Tax=Sinorhizobium terangae TaxID=110322 RepID=UPI0024B059CE|nr:hypothetical protein [Sinorhizobium terangae]WFU51690.1 hypothetical protein QA637_29875 [Sinorhizobium terangae]